VGDKSGDSRYRTVEVVPAVPVRMTEAWLLFDEAAIRRAAGCPNGSMPLELPSLKTSEDIPDPKTILHEALRKGQQSLWPSTTAVHSGYQSNFGSNR